jgi:SAM-dependent methyltransferase
VKLNLGAGEPFSHARARAYPDWIDIDVRSSTRPTVVADVRALPFADGSATHVFAGHILEHVDLDLVVDVAREIRRVLAAGGHLLVVGPDVPKSIKLHAEGLITDERLASNRRHGEPGNVCVHQWDSEPGVVLGFLRVLRFVDVAQIPVQDTPADFPVFDRGSLDQFAVVGTRP